MREIRELYRQAPPLLMDVCGLLMVFKVTQYEINACMRSSSWIVNFPRSAKYSTKRRKILTKLTFVDNQGSRHEVNAVDGLSVMKAAVDNNIPGIHAECGGNCSCATCHCYVSGAGLNRLKPMDDLEDGMLDGAVERRSNSRLACQILVSGELEGIEFEIGDNII